MPYQFECAALGCVFLIRAADEEEVIAQVQRHSEERHEKSSPPEGVICERMEAVDVK
jgi:predicted small metal-binding protein